MEQKSNTEKENHSEETLEDDSLPLSQAGAMAEELPLETQEESSEELEDIVPLAETFEELSLIPEVLKAVEEKGYTSPTPIQAQAIPLILAGRDIVGASQTGTGKTAAFALPLLSKIKPMAREAKL